MNREERAKIAADTMAIIEAGRYQLEDGRTVSIADDMARCYEGTRLFRPDDLSELIKNVHIEYRPTSGSATIELANETTLAGVAALRRETSGVVGALNFASAKNPGGGFLSGSQAQEESLARSSALHGSLMREWSYYEYHRATSSPVYTDALILSPDCPVFRDDEGELRSRPDLVTFISGAAPNAGQIEKICAQELAQIPDILRRRCRYVLGLAVRSGCKNFVLGAWGCGVFRNDPDMVARAFANLILNEGWGRMFECIRFSVLDTTPDQRIYGPFSKTLAVAL
ncbi:MAG: TIGR02452 family protein [Aquabacterium sp.]